MTHQADKLSSDLRTGRCDKCGTENVALYSMQVNRVRDIYEYWCAACHQATASYLYKMR